jgi:ATP-binding cassette subfamily B protein
MPENYSIKSFIWNAVKPFKFYLALHLLVVIYAATELSLTPYLTKIFLDNLTTIERSQAVAKTWPIVLTLIIIWWFNGAIWRIADFSWMRLSPRLKKKITVESMDYLMQHSFTFFQNNFSGSLANKVRDLANCTQQILEKFLYNFFNAALSIIISFIALLSVNWYFAMGMLIWALAFVFIAIRGGKTASALGIPVADQQTKITGFLVDILSNISSVKLFARRQFESQNIAQAQDDYTHLSEKKNWFLLKFFAISAVAFCLYYSACFVALVYFYQQGTVTLGDFFLIFGINNWMIHLMWMTAQEYRNVLEDIGTMNQALSFLNEPWKIKDETQAENFQTKQSGGEIIFENVSFSYSLTQPEIFSKKSIIIKPGEKVGLVGHSGSGKSTFVNLILRLFDINSGRILIDGQDIAKVTQDSLRQSIGIIPQDPALFHRTLAENIAYSSDVDLTQIIEAAKKAHAHDFIQQLPDNYQSLVGERGVKLSGGQRQRIAIARAFIKNAPILILDEATSALDSVTEEMIQNSLDNLMQNKTTLVIAHRLSTLRNLDRILVFEKGKIVEDGSHQELLALNGTYKKLWDSQVGGFIVENSDDAPPSQIFSPYSFKNLINQNW